MDNFIFFYMYQISIFSLYYVILFDQILLFDLLALVSQKKSLSEFLLWLKTEFSGAPQNVFIICLPVFIFEAVLLALIIIVKSN